MGMVNLKRAAEPKGTLMAAEPDEPGYPYGLCLHLDEDTLAKLGVTSLPKAGVEVMLRAKALVTSTNVRNEAAEPGEAETAETETAETERSVELQITDMEFAGSARDAAGTLYGGD